MRHFKLLAATVGLLCAAGAVQAAVVNPFNTSNRGWRLAKNGNGNLKFRNGPGETLCGKGSIELRIGKRADSAAQVQYKRLNKTALVDLTELLYSTFISPDWAGNPNFAPYVILNIDQDGDGVVDDLLFFEPANQSTQTAVDLGIDQDEVLLGEWQEWDARNGLWYSLNDVLDGTLFLFTLDDYAASFPDAMIANSPNSEFGPGLRIVAGFAGEDWSGFVGSIDCVVIGTGDAESETFDFELRRR